jgi:hypothetical protein
VTILHVVALAAKAGMGPDLEGALEAAKQLAQQPGVLSLDAGPDVSVEGLAGGFTHAIVVRFTDETGRAGYLSSPAHDQVARQLGACVDRIVVIDVAAAE